MDLELAPAAPGRPALGFARVEEAPPIRRARGKLPGGIVSVPVERPPTSQKIAAEHRRIPGSARRLNGDLAALEQLSQELRANDWKVRLALRDAAGGHSARRDWWAPSRARPCWGWRWTWARPSWPSTWWTWKRGATLAQTGVMNPQIAYGEDVVNRIAFANQSEGNRRCCRPALVEALNGAARRAVRPGPGACQRRRADRGGGGGGQHRHAPLLHRPAGGAAGGGALRGGRQRGAGVAGGRTGAGVCPGRPGVPAGQHRRLRGRRPHRGPAGHPLLPGPAARAGGYRHQHRDQPGEWTAEIYSCSTASGPAFEGAHIHDGMRAAPGAIERVHLRDGRVQVATIGGLAPVGICGSGILQAVARDAGGGGDRPARDAAQGAPGRAYGLDGTRRSSCWCRRRAAATGGMW